jgi:hypothetical protein
MNGSTSRIIPPPCAADDDYILFSSTTVYNISIIESGGCGLIAFNTNLVHTTTE